MKRIILPLIILFVSSGFAQPPGFGGSCAFCDFYPVCDAGSAPSCIDICTTGSGEVCTGGMCSTETCYETTCYSNRKCPPKISQAYCQNAPCDESFKEYAFKNDELRFFPEAGCSGKGTCDLPFGSGIDLDTSQYYCNNAPGYWAWGRFNYVGWARKGEECCCDSNGIFTVMPTENCVDVYNKFLGWIHRACVDDSYCGTEMYSCCGNADGEYLIGDVCCDTSNECVIDNVCQDRNPSIEICDGLDNDCDGSVDEGLGSTTCGVGVCSRTVQNCVDGVSQDCVPGSPGVEVCDGLDNDCDGSVDEVFVLVLFRIVLME